MRENPSRRPPSISLFLATVDRLASLPLPTLLGGGGVALVLGALGAWFGWDDQRHGPVWMTLTLAMSFTPLGLFILRRVPGHPVGRLMVATGLVSTLATLAVCWSGVLALAWLSQWLWWPPLGLIIMTLLLFPDGALPSPRWRILAWVLVAATTVATLGLLLAASAAPRTLLSALDDPIPPLALASLRLAFAAIVLTLLAGVAVAASVVVRWRRAAAPVRRQIACLLPSAVLLVLGFGLDFVNVPGAWVAAAIAFPVGVAVAILRYQMFDLDLYVHRGLVWAILTTTAVVAYAAAVGALQRVLPGSRTASAAIVGGAVAAAALVPTQTLAHRWASRVAYGRRDDPYAVLVRAGRQLADTQDPLAVLPNLTTSLVETMRVPYAAVRLATERELATDVSAGRPVDETEAFPMLSHGAEVGQLLVGRRSPSEAFTPGERDLLDQLATQAALAADAVRSALELQRARDGLVYAREEERRRLRQELHDGVASGLTGARMLNAAIRRDMVGSPVVMAEQLDAELRRCWEEVRDIVDDLRPAALDAGLRAALAQQVQGYAATGPHVLFEVDGSIDDLPAAIEVVAYRTLGEALTNVRKHAPGSECAVRVLRTRGRLLLTVRDWGPGLESQSAPSRDHHHDRVGLAAMRSRAEEVGGTLLVSPGQPGTLISIDLPIAHAPPRQEPDP